MKKALVHMSKQIAIHLFFWAAVWYFFKTFFSVGTSNSQFIFWFSTILSVISVVASYVFIYDLIPTYLLRKEYNKFLLYTIYSGVFVTCGVFMTMAFGFIFYFNLEFQRMPELTKSSSVILVCVVLIIVLVSGIKILSHNYKSLEKNKALENKFLQAQLELKEQELKFLKMQIHPHFLFNSLNTIYGFALTKKEEAPEMILKLSNLLDYILYQVDRPTVPLRDEIAHVEDYISLEEMRFNDTLVVDFKKKNIVETVEVAPMLLIPFVENSFKHGSIINGKLQVYIQVYIADAILYISIENSSNNSSNATPGIGMGNIKKRLDILYPNAYELEARPINKMFKVLLKVQINGLKRTTNV